MAMLSVLRSVRTPNLGGTCLAGNQGGPQWLCSLKYHVFMASWQWKAASLQTCHTIFRGKPSSGGPLQPSWHCPIQFVLHSLHMCLCNTRPPRLGTFWANTALLNKQTCYFNLILKGYLCTPTGRELQVGNPIGPSI